MGLRDFSIRRLFKGSKGNIDDRILEDWQSYCDTSWNKTDIWNAYNTISSFKDSVKKISKRVSNIDLVERKGEDIIEDGDLEELLTNSLLFNKTNLIYQITRDYCVFSESYVKITKGSIMGKITDIRPISPLNITPMDNYNNSYPRTIANTQGGSIVIYEREIDMDYGYYFVNREDKNDYIIHIFEELDRNDTPVLSVKSIELSLKILKEGLKHNSKFLANGAVLSSILSFPPGTNDNPIGLEDLEKIKDKFKGFSNSGKTALLPGDVKHISLSTSNKDMLFDKVMEDSDLRIYKFFEIPLALISKETMTYDNLSSANLSLYEDVIIPLANQLLKKVTTFLTKEKEHYLEVDISSINAVINNRLNTIEATEGILTKNERRERLFYPELEDEALELLAPMEEEPKDNKKEEKPKEDN